MLSISDLKTWLHRDLGQQEKLLLVLSSFDSPCQIQDIGERAEEAGFRLPKSWNPSNSLARSKGKAIRTGKGWELSESGKQYLRNLGVSKIGPAAIQVATDLREILSQINDSEIRSFLEEAIGCYEAQFFRSAIVMSWTGAVSVLHKYVHSNYLIQFNTEAKRVNPRWRDAIAQDDLGNMREGEFLDRIAAISIISNDVKKELKNCLTRRNSCGHANSFKVSANTAAHHIEILILNVFEKLQ